MRLIKPPAALSVSLRRLRLKGRSIGLVPTMGALHEGHLSLIRRARKDNDVVVVSIFVNPTQFGPKEDLKRYPRPGKRDLALCRKNGVDFVFMPPANDMYPEGFSTYVEVEGLSGLLCGRHRPGHFRGVATVVAKLLNIVQPDTAYFGRKDAQQSVIISRMVRDLNFPVKIKIMPVIRDYGGLALSSRNAFLSLGQRRDALVLYQSLQLAVSLFNSGLKDAKKIVDCISRLIKTKRGARIDYIEIVDSRSLEPVSRAGRGDLIVLAVRIGKVRLIDNLAL